MTLADVETAMPTDLGALYSSWISVNPGKAGRLAAIVLEAVNVFREAVKSWPANVLDDATDTVPTTGRPFAMIWIYFTLGMEMGVPFGPEAVGLMTRADIWLRMVQNGAITIGVGDVGAPHYEAPVIMRGVLL